MKLKIKIGECEQTLIVEPDGLRQSEDDSVLLPVLKLDLNCPHVHQVKCKVGWKTVREHQDMFDENPDITLEIEQ